MTKTTLTQRILFGAIAIFMVMATIIMYVAMVMSTNSKNQPNYPANAQQQAERQKLLNEYIKKLNERNKYLAKIGTELSKTYYDQFKEYKTANKPYNAQTIKELTKKDLKVGDGAEITKDSTNYRAYYIGWLADGKVFDGSFDGDKLKAPLEGSNNMIEGWKEGIIGMKIGGVREIAIPAAKAYGNKKQNGIPANSPLKFIIKLIPPMTAEEKAKVPKL